MRNSIDTARSGLGAFVTRRKDPDGIEIAGTRRFRGRLNAVAAARGLWSRVFKSEKRRNEAGPSVSRVVPSVNSALSVRAQMMDLVAVPTREINGLAEDWDVGLFPGSFPSDETLQGLFVSSSDQASTDDAAMVPLPLQFAEEILQLGRKSSPLIVTDSSPYPESDLSCEIASPLGNTAVSTIHHSLSLFPRTSSTRVHSPDWIPAPDHSRQSPDTLATRSRPDSEVTSKPHSDIDLLVNSIERFRFTTLVKSTIIDNVQDTRDTVYMTSANLLNIGWDMKRLLVIWSRITSNAPDVGVLRVLQPWVCVPSEAVAKACGLMQKGLQTYRDWKVISDHALMTAQQHHTISDGWWAIHHKRFQELDGVNQLDFDDAFAQVELVMEKYLGFEKEAAVMRKPAPARRERMTNATFASNAVSIVDTASPSTDDSTSASSRESQRPSSGPSTRDWVTTAVRAAYTSDESRLPLPGSRCPKTRQAAAPSSLSSAPSSPKSRGEEREGPRYPTLRRLSSPVTSAAGPSSLKSSIKNGPRYPKIQQVSKPIAGSPGPFAPKLSMKDGKQIKKEGAILPDNDRSTKASPKTSQPTKTLPSYMRPTKATRGAYTPPVKFVTNATPAPRSSRLEFAIRGEQAKRSPTNTSTRLVEIKASSTLPERAPSILSQSTKRMKPKDLPKQDMIDHSDSVHEPYVLRGTAPRGPSPLWTSSPLICSSTDAPLEVGRSDPSRFHPTDDKGDTHGVGKMELEKETLPRVEPEGDANVEVALVSGLDPNETANKFDSIRARMFEMEVKLQAMNAETTVAASKAEAEADSDAAEEHLVLAVDEKVEEDSSAVCSASKEVEVRQVLDQSPAAIDKQAKAGTDDAMEPLIRIIGRWGSEYDDTDNDDNEDEDVWYDASEVCVEDECL
ncbi:hypothetical protein AA0111_g11717 [Alternaria arborescens]|uniref:hypothetical protein n=1 Tax=Alternaria arborescens TaxID=156630 RepID=UPI00107500D2|nr:hypothetical protein AA0111_g11717 [Alternaria arborescens]RYO15394.1 hypothetical protein AA0111_g11717 [Alternaria arborescens]